MTAAKRLIEVDLPIRTISAHGRNEKNMRSGHPWHLHIWWARRPWGACRAVALASLLPAPSDPQCPASFVEAAGEILRDAGYSKKKSATPADIQTSLLRFVGDYAEWEAGANPTYREAGRRIVAAAYPDGAPFVFDPFSGYGAIPGEAARLGCESVALDLNPVALLCLRTLLEAAQKHGQGLLDAFEAGASFVKKEAKKRLRDYYPERDHRAPIAWLWARTVNCEGPSCGAVIPLVSQNTIAKGSRKAWIEVTGDKATKTVAVHVRSGKVVPAGLKKTAGGGHATCPVCGVTTNKERVKVQGKTRKIGHRLFGVATAIGERAGKEYADASQTDQDAFARAVTAWAEIVRKNPNAEITEKYPFHDPRAFTAGLYGITTWGDLFSPRQKLALFTIGEILRDYGAKLKEEGTSPELARDVVTALALAVSNSVHYSTTMSTWLSEGMISCFIAGNAIAMRWDYAEANLLVDTYAGGLDFAFKKAAEALRVTLSIRSKSTTVMRANATECPLPDDVADMLFTDPPYYDVVPYADLSDVCYVWLRRFVGDLHPDLLADRLTPKADQIVVNPYSTLDDRGDQSPEQYQKRMTEALRESRRALKPEGIGAIVFAHKGTSAWETLLASIIDAGFIVTASWPIDTERAARMRANNSAVLGSSVHIIVRPRENADGSLRASAIGDWRKVLAELNAKVHDWLPRLAGEGIVGADAIFACLGPALEVFSRYSRVEEVSGDEVKLGKYLEYVWAVVAREALTMLFSGAETQGMEPDARLTAMWLWTLAGPAPSSEEPGDEEEDEEEARGKSAGFVLEYDAARKIAQGLGAHLGEMTHLVEIKGDVARLFSVSERSSHLFGRDRATGAGGKAPARKKQTDLFPELEDIAAQQGWGEMGAPEAGATTLDRIHQAMLLFGAGRSEALRRFLVEEGVGAQTAFWKLAQSLSALYPARTDEKRWIDGVLSRKKSLGF